MPHKNPALDRTGVSQSFKTRVAANLNFFKRSVMGFIAQTHIHHNMMWIERHPDYSKELTEERREQLQVIEKAAWRAREAATKVKEEIDKYYTLPSTEQPKRARQRAAKTAQNTRKTVEKLS